MLAGKVVLRVYLLDNFMKTLLVEERITAGEVCKLLVDQIGFSKPDIASNYALHVCDDGVTLGPPLADASKVVEIMDSWGEGSPCKFVFTCKLFMEALKKSSDPKVQYMFFIQAVYNVIAGIYPITVEEAVELAAIQLCSKHGPHNPEIHRVGFLKNQLIGYIPGTLLAKRQPSAWETDIFAAHAVLGCSQDEAPHLYCSKLSERDFYGCAFFSVSQSFSRKLPKLLLLGVNGRGIYLFDKDTLSTYEHYSLSEIFRWGFVPKTTFYYEVKKQGGAGPIKEFRTKQGNVVSDLLTDYAMGLLKEMGLGQSADSESKSAAGAAAAPAAGGTAAAGTTAAGRSGNEQAASATKMQAMFRGYRVRRRLERDFAAVRIQAVYRGFKARCRFDEMIARMEAELAAAEAGDGRAVY